MSSFKEKNTFEQRSTESRRVREKYPDRIPVIVENSGNFLKENVPELDKNKYLVPNELTMGQLTYTIRKRIRLEPSQGLFVMIGNGVLAPTSALLVDLYEKYADEDGFIYCQLSGENTFGN